MINWFWFKRWKSRKRVMCKTCMGSGVEENKISVSNGLYEVEPLTVYHKCPACRGRGRVWVNVDTK